MPKDPTKVGIGVIVANKDGKILIGKRKGGHAPYYSIPGGSIEPGETFEQCAVREVKEETNLDIKDPRVVSVTNNLETYKKEGVHFVSVVLATEKFEGEPELKEPDKCEHWLWADPNNLPRPHFDASARGVACWLDRKFYIKFE